MSQDIKSYSFHWSFRITIRPLLIKRGRRLPALAVSGTEDMLAVKFKGGPEITNDSCFKQSKSVEEAILGISLEKRRNPPSRKLALAEHETQKHSMSSGSSISFWIISLLDRKSKRYV